MINNHISVTNNVTEEISTGSYDLHWQVAHNGYEWRNQDDLFFDSEIDANFHSLSVHHKFASRLFRYDRNALFNFVFDNYSAPPTSLYERPPLGQRAPAIVDTQPPWIVEKGSLELAKRYALTKPELWLNLPPLPKTEYEPLSYLTLHRKFAALDGDNLEIQVQQFANRYGLLGRPATLWSPESTGEPDSFRDLYAPNRFRWQLPPDKRALVHGESLHRWRGEIERMGVLLALWDLIRKREVGKLGQLVLWVNNDTVLIRFKWRYHNRRYEVSKWDGVQEQPEFGYHNGLIATRKMLPAFFSEFTHRDVIEPARWFLSIYLNLQLSGVSPRLTGFRVIEITFIPETLLDALWILFMLEVQGKIRSERCKYCGDWFDYERNTKSFCSDNHRRLYFYHHKQKKGGTK